MRAAHQRLKVMVLLSLILCCFTNTQINSQELGKHARIHLAELQTPAQQTLHYAYSGISDKPGLLFIHGTPGSWRAFDGYLGNTELQNDFFMVSIDRPGWGNSERSKKDVNGDFATQSESIGAIFIRYPNKKWILVGHSLGASIAPKVALDYPNDVSGLLLLAGSLKPSLGAPRWYNRFASTWVIAKLIGKEMTYSNREIMALRKQLSLMDKEVKQRFLPVDMIIMQGKKDRLVSPKNPAYAKSAWSGSFNSISLDEIEDEGHFLPWRQTSRVIELIYELQRGNSGS